MTTPTLERSPDELRGRLRELRGDLTELSAGERSDDANGRMRTLVSEVNTLDTELTIALALQEREADRTGPTAGTLYIPGGDTRSAGDLVVEDSEFASWMERGAAGASPIVTLRAGIRAPVFEFGPGGPGNVAGTGVSTLLPVAQPIVPAPRRTRLFMRDLIPVQRTTLAQIPYVRELNPVNLEGGVTSVPEGGVKPEVSIAFAGAIANITVLAGNITVSKQLMADAPTVIDYINGRLPYLVQIREDAEILAGLGVWPDILGIRNQPGVQTGTATAGDPVLSIANGLATVEMSDGQADAVVMNPLDAWAMFTRRASTSGVLDAGAPFSTALGQSLTVWGLPVKRSRVYPRGRCLVGDFGMGAIIFDREEVNVQVYPQHANYPVLNQVLIQGEERLGLAVPRPDLFVDQAV